jgi:hypothetical protein
MGWNDLKYAERTPIANRTVPDYKAVRRLGRANKLFTILTRRKSCAVALTRLTMLHRTVIL